MAHHNPAREEEDEAEIFRRVRILEVASDVGDSP